MHAVCVGHSVLMSPGCSQCGEEGCSVHGRCAGGQQRQSAGEPAGQRRYSDGCNTVCADSIKAVIIKRDNANRMKVLKCL